MLATTPEPLRSGAPLIEVTGVTKRFGSLVANDDISLSVNAGEVHALLGENGAGKSTLTRILYGLSQPDAGQISIEGRPVRFGSPKDAMRAGIGMVTQEFSLVGPMTVTENLMLAEIGYGPVDRRVARAGVLAASERIGVHVDPDATVESLSVGQRQRVEILKALHHDCRVLVLDEPTAVLVPQDVHRLFESIRRLTAGGMGVMFISHKLHEVMEIADRITVIRRGRHVATKPMAELDPARIAGLMMGSAPEVALEELPEAELGPGDGPGTGRAHRPAIPAAPPGAPRADELPTHATSQSRAEPPSLAIRHVSMVLDGVEVLADVSIEVGRGEIVGVAGVSGNGQTELVNVLCATMTPTSGAIELGGRDVTTSDPIGRIRAGLGRITEDRRGSVVPGLSMEQNLVLEDLEQFTRFGFTRRGQVRDHTRRLIDEFDIRADPQAAMRTLSGGNMQKVLLARALARRPSALVVSQPTRGLDVGACNYVYDQLRAVRARGGGILLVSDDIDELLLLADRILVLYSGRVIGEVGAAEATPDALGLLMTGHTVTGSTVTGSTVTGSTVAS